MKKTNLLFLILVLSLGCQNQTNKDLAFVPESSGNLNHITVVMPETDWKGELGAVVREELQQIYEGLPIDEPQYSINYLNPENIYRLCSSE